MTQPFTISLKAARVENGLTQDELAKKIGVTKRTIVAWENGEAPVRPYALYSMAYIYGMDVEQLRVPPLKPSK